MIQYVSYRDFYISSIPQFGNVLGTKIGGLALVIFQSDNCNVCAKVIKPLMYELDKLISGCTIIFADILDGGAALYKMSQQTIMKIEAVPFIVLYNNGQPLMEYKGAATIEGFLQFLNAINEKLKMRQPFTKSEAQAMGKCPVGDNGIPGYCIGKPITDDNLCMLTFGDAYGKCGVK